MNLQFLMPTRVISGPECVRKNSQIFSSLGKRALIVTGSRSAKENGSLSDLEAAFADAGVEWRLFDRVMSNPSIACAYEGAALAKSFGAEFIAAIGGGSPMDAGKAIALLACQDIAEESLFSGNYGKQVLPMAFIPTTAGTGSEVTQYSILTSDRAKTKLSIATPLLFPTVSFLDAKYTRSLSRVTTVNTAVDAFSHLFEGMLSIRANPLSDLMAREGMLRILACRDGLLSGDLTSEDRENLLYASMLGGMVIAQTGTTAVHAMGYSLTYFRHIDHGRANGLLLPSFFRFVEQKDSELAASVLAALSWDSSDRAGAFLVPLLGNRESISEEELRQYAAIAVKAGNIKNCRVVLTEEDILQIYRESLG